MNPPEQKISVQLRGESQDLDIDIKKYWLILKRRWLPIVTIFLSVSGMTVLAISSKKPMYTAEGKLLVKTDQTSSLTGLGADTRKALAPLTAQGNPLKTQSEIILSKPILGKTIIALNLKDSKGNFISEGAIKSQLEVTNIAGTDVLKISSRTSNPKEAAALINKLMSLYIENNIATNRSEAVAARKFIARQLPETEEAVRQAELRLRGFKERNKISSLSDEGSSTERIIADLQGRIAETQARLADINAQSTALMNKVGMNSEQAMAASILSQSAAVQSVLSELQKVENLLAAERSRFQDESPSVVALKNKEETLKVLLQERISEALGNRQLAPDNNLQPGMLEQELIKNLINLEVERLGLSNQITSLAKTQTAYRQRRQILPQLEQEQRELQRRLDASQATYQTLLTKLQEVQVSENQNIGNAVIIELASLPKQPSVSKSALILALGGGVFAVLLSTAAVIILELRDPSIKTVKEAQDIFSYPLLGAIPSWNKKTLLRNKRRKQSVLKIPLRDSPRSPISERYRRLEANLDFLRSDQPLKVIVVTSSVPEEGKSTVAANLAVVLAESHRVLLVDADMHHPFQHDLWELTNEAGLSNVIVGQVESQLAVKQVMLNLDVLTSGVTPPNPVALLKSREMVSLIEHSSKKYDFVIIDTPPLMLASDALILGKMKADILLVAGLGVVDSASATASKEYLEQSGQTVLGLVVNGVTQENDSKLYSYSKSKHYAKKDSANLEDDFPQKEEYSAHSLNFNSTNNKKPQNLKINQK